MTIATAMLAASRISIRAAGSGTKITSKQAMIPIGSKNWGNCFVKFILVNHLRAQKSGPRSKLGQTLRKSEKICQIIAGSAGVTSSSSQSDCTLSMRSPDSKPILLDFDSKLESPACCTRNLRPSKCRLFKMAYQGRQ